MEEAPGNVEQRCTSGLEFRLGDASRERNAVNQLANCCPLLDATPSDRFSRWNTVWQLSFSAGATSRAPSGEIPRLIETEYYGTLGSLERSTVFQRPSLTTPPANWIDRRRAIIGFSRIESSRRSCCTSKPIQGLG